VIIPGCTQLGDCDGRTSVDIEVFPTKGGLGWTSTISEQVQVDTKTLVYSGMVQASSSDFSPTISLALAANPAKPANGNNYIVVADAVQLVLTSVGSSPLSAGMNGSSVNGSTPTSMQITNSTSKVAYGLFEYNRSSTSMVNAASSSLSNITETPLTQLGFTIEQAANMSGFPAWSINTISSLGNNVYIGGKFTSPGNWSNVLSVDISSGVSTPLPSQGLNGVVTSSAVIGSYIYIGGSFTSTGSGTPLAYLARYDPSSKSWSQLAGGVDGPISSLSSSSNLLLVSGNFSHTLSSGGQATSSGGYAVYDTSASSWTSSGVLYGNVSTVASASNQIYLGGRVMGSSGNSVNGVAILSNSNGQATISTLNGVSLGPPSSSTSAMSKRSRHKRSAYTHLIAKVTEFIVTVSPLVNRAISAPAIMSIPAPAPAVLAGGFYMNGSTSVTILGGNFSSTVNGSTVQSLGFYSGTSLSGASGINGVVKAVEVVNDLSYVGGTGVTVNGVGSGVVVYDLAHGKWNSGNMPSLSGMSSLYNSHGSS